MLYKISPLSEQAITINFGSIIDIKISQKLVAMKDWLEKATLPSVRDIVIAYSSLTICYEFYTLRKAVSDSPYRFLEQKLVEAFEKSSATSSTVTAWKIPVCYESSFAPDMTSVAEQKQLSINEIVDIHTSTTYNVFMIGFLPGFPYLAELDERIHVPRKTSPAAVARGSVGLAGKQTGIYPADSPGGWQIIGRTPMSLFDKHSDPPVRISIGDSVKFFSIGEDEFNYRNDRG